MEDASKIVYEKKTSLEPKLKNLWIRSWFM